MPSRVAWVERDQMARLEDKALAARNHVWWSTHESIAAEVPSVTAIIETILAVLLYWWIAIHLGTYAHLLLGVCVAPLVLLRSDASVAMGLAWFEDWELKITEE